MANGARVRGNVRTRVKRETGQNPVRSRHCVCIALCICESKVTERSGRPPQRVKASVRKPAVLSGTKDHEALIAPPRPAKGFLWHLHFV